MNIIFLKGNIRKLFNFEKKLRELDLFKEKICK